MIFSQLPASPSFITFQFVAFDVSLSEICTGVYVKYTNNIEFVALIAISHFVSDVPAKIVEVFYLSDMAVKIDPVSYEKIGFQFFIYTKHENLSHSFSKYFL